ncbi:MAG: bifunctional riboflavin kinase/FAD synthetase [Acidimicrobiales bacterium]|nr:bifunctional riboflavin kinase/FAD synthetase [Acidimicrobiales bacterium]
MEVLRDEQAVPRLAGGTAVTIGAYDGVHLGHRAVVAQVHRLAAERGLRTAVVTFDRHPASVVRPESAPCLLTDLEQKLELLARTGVDYTLVIHFDEARSKEPAEDFVTEVLVGALQAQVVVVGEDFHFGHQRRGNVALLREMGNQLGFDVQGIELVGVDGQPASPADRVSSTAIRAALRQGRIEDANRMLGRSHEVRGKVGNGDRRATELGYPTANIDVPAEVCLPNDGIYAGWYLRPDGRRHQAAISLGRRPTFYEDQPFSLLEAHILDFEGDLYGETARIQFVTRLRDELKFESVDALVAQIEQDCNRVRQVMAALP